MKATEIVCVIDKSGSMGAIRNDAIGGFNSFLEDQQKLKGKINLTVVLFDTEYQIWETKPVKKHPKLDTTNYIPSGATALLDAVGRSISELHARLDKLTKAKRPDKAIFVIITDGQENSSKELKRGQIKEMIEECQKNYGWQFIFLGANVDAFHEAAQIGIQANMAVNFIASPQGTRSAYRATSNAVTSYVISGAVDKDWKKLVKKAN